MTYLFGSSLGYDQYARSSPVSDAERGILILIVWIHGFFVCAAIVTVLINHFTKRWPSVKAASFTAIAAVGAFLISIHPLLLLTEYAFSCAFGLWALYLGIPLMLLPIFFQAYEAHQRHRSMIYELTASSSRDVILESGRPHSTASSSSLPPLRKSRPYKNTVLMDFWVRVVIYGIVLAIFIIAAIINQYSRDYYHSNSSDVCWWTDAEVALLQVLLLVAQIVLFVQALRILRITSNSVVDDPLSVSCRQQLFTINIIIFIWNGTLLFYPGIWTLYFTLIVLVLITCVASAWPLVTAVRLPADSAEASTYDLQQHPAGFGDHDGGDPRPQVSRANKPTLFVEMQETQPSSSSSSSSASGAAGRAAHKKLSISPSIASNVSGQSNLSSRSNALAASADSSGEPFVVDDPMADELRKEQDRLEQEELGMVNRIGKRLHKQLLVKESGVALVIESGGVATLGRSSARPPASPSSSRSPAALAAFAKHKAAQDELAKSNGSKSSAESAAASEEQDTVPDDLGQSRLYRPGSFLGQAAASRTSLTRSSNSSPDPARASGLAKGSGSNLVRSPSNLSGQGGPSGPGGRSSLRLAEQVALEIELPPGPRPTTLKQVLTNPQYIEIFKKFSLGVYCSENILFYMEVAQFRTMMSKYLDGQATPGTASDAPSIAAVNVKMNEIFDLFISPHALMQVNISFDARQPIIKAVDLQSPQLTVFDVAQKEVLKLMNADTWPKFRQLMFSKAS